MSCKSLGEEGFRIPVIRVQRADKFAACSVQPCEECEKLPTIFALPYNRDLAASKRGDDLAQTLPVFGRGDVIDNDTLPVVMRLIQQ